MKYYACDTSALSKRYHSERSSPFMIKLTDDVLETAPHRLVVTRLIVAEIVSVLKRRFNSHSMTNGQLAASLQSLNTDTAIMSGIAMDDDTIDAAHSIILRHNLNSSDAIFYINVLRLRRLCDNLATNSC